MWYGNSERVQNVLHSVIAGRYSCGRWCVPGSAVALWRAGGFSCEDVPRNETPRGSALRANAVIKQLSAGHSAPLSRQTSDTLPLNRPVSAAAPAAPLFSLHSAGRCPVFRLQRVSPGSMSPRLIGPFLCSLPRQLQRFVIDCLQYVMDYFVSQE